MVEGKRKKMLKKKNIVLFGAILAGLTAVASLSDGIMYEDDFTDGDRWAAASVNYLYETIWSNITEKAYEHAPNSLTGKYTCDIDGVVVCRPEFSAYNTSSYLSGVTKGLEYHVTDLDFTVEMASADPTLADADEYGTMTDAQIAIASGTTNEQGLVKMWLYHENDSGAAEWKQFATVAHKSTNTVYAVFLNGTCELTFNDEYLGAFTTVADADKVTNLVFNGATSLDYIRCADLHREFTDSDLVADGTSIAGIKVAYTNLNSNVWAVNLDADTGSVSGGDGTVTDSASTLTVATAKQLLTGLTTDGAVATFMASEFARAGETITVKVPCEYDNNQSYQAVFYGADGTTVLAVSGATAGDIAEGKRDITFTFPTIENSTEKVLLFTIEAYAPGAGGTTVATT